MSLSAGHGWSRLGDEVAREGDEPVGVAVEEGLPVAAPLHPHLGRGRYLHNVHKMLRIFDPPPRQATSHTTEIGKKAWLFAKLQPGRARKRINAT